MASTWRAYSTSGCSDARHRARAARGAADRAPGVRGCARRILRELERARLRRRGNRGALRAGECQPLARACAARAPLPAAARAGEARTGARRHDLRRGGRPQALLARLRHARRGDAGCGAAAVAMGAGRVRARIPLAHRRDACAVQSDRFLGARGRAHSRVGRRGARDPLAAARGRDAVAVGEGPRGALARARGVLSVRVLVTGAAGQLGQALIAAAPAGLALKACTHAELDIADEAAVRTAFADFAPELVINAAAFTRVDEAERAAERAARANAQGPRVLADACRSGGCWLTHVSTDFVFDGRQGHPYAPDAQPNPLSVYGRSKLQGEKAVLGVLAQRCTVVRASWLYSAAGGFAGRMLELMRTRPQLKVVSDQVGAPTH